MASLGIKAADTDQSTCPPDREELGRGTWALVRLDRIALGPMAQSALAAEPRRLLLHACFAASFDGSVLPRPAPGRGRDLNAKLYPRPRALLPLLPLRRGAPLRLGAAATDVSRCHTARCRTVGRSAARAAAGAVTRPLPPALARRAIAILLCLHPAPPNRGARAGWRRGSRWCCGCAGSTTLSTSRSGSPRSRAPCGPWTSGGGTGGRGAGSRRSRRPGSRLARPPRMMTTTMPAMPGTTMTATVTTRSLRRFGRSSSAAGDAASGGGDTAHPGGLNCRGHRLAASPGTQSKLAITRRPAQQRAADHLLPPNQDESRLGSCSSGPGASAGVAYTVTSAMITNL